LAQTMQAAQQKEFDEALKLPVIQDILKVFPDAQIRNVKKRTKE